MLHVSLILLINLVTAMLAQQTISNEYIRPERQSLSDESGYGSLRGGRKTFEADLSLDSNEVLHVEKIYLNDDLSINEKNSRDLYLIRANCNDFKEIDCCFNMVCGLTLKHGIAEIPEFSGPEVKIKEGYYYTLVITPLNSTFINDNIEITDNDVKISDMHIDSKIEVENICLEMCLYSNLIFYASKNSDGILVFNKVETDGKYIENIYNFLVDLFYKVKTGSNISSSGSSICSAESMAPVYESMMPRYDIYDIEELAFTGDDYSNGTYFIEQKDIYRNLSFDDKINDLEHLSNPNPDKKSWYIGQGGIFIIILICIVFIVSVCLYLYQYYYVTKVTDQQVGH